MLNTISLICINSALARSLCFFESNRRCYASHTSVFFFLLAFVWQAAVSFR